MNQDQAFTTELAQRYPKGAVVAARVRVLNPYGAVMTLDDGTTGIIHNREMSWEQEIEHPGEVLTEGQSVKALVLGIDRTRPRLKLSLRQVGHDPWQKMEKQKVGADLLSAPVKRCFRLCVEVARCPAGQSRFKLG